MLRQLLCASALFLAACGNAQAQLDIKGCNMYVNFEEAAQAQTWRAVNDGVMGGRSSGGPSFENGHMIFEGVINTNGGGFSSLRSPVEDGALAQAAGLKLRVKSDGRAYKVTLRTNVAYRGRLVSFQAPIAGAEGGEWSDVIVPFSDLKASIFGRRVSGAKFDPAAIREMGIILADGQDGPFRLEVDWIKDCKD